jgi:hypothetical protein
VPAVHAESVFVLLYLRAVQAERSWHGTLRVRSVPEVRAEEGVEAVDYVVASLRLRPEEGHLSAYVSIRTSAYVSILRLRPEEGHLSAYVSITRQHNASV